MYEIALITNLPFEIIGKEIIRIYFKSYEIEKKYYTLKNKMKFESITGKAILYVYQEFWTQIVVYNMNWDIIHASNDVIIKDSRKHQCKYPIRINENIAIVLFKESFIKILIEPNNKSRNLIELKESIERYVVPLRIIKSRNKKHNITNKYENNEKSSF